MRNSEELKFVKVVIIHSLRTQKATGTMALTTITTNTSSTFTLWNILVTLEVYGSLLQISGRGTLLLLVLPTQKAFLDYSTLRKSG